MRPRERLTAILVAVTVGVALAALGSAPRWAACLAAALALAAAAPQVLSRRAAETVPPLLLLIALALVLTALQLVPWPAPLLALIAPAKLELLRDNAAALGQAAPAFGAISYDPPATLVELAKLAGYGAFAYACMRLCATGPGRRWLAHAVAVAGVAMAAIALGHHVLGMDTLFGVYRPRTAASSYLAPLLNENHLAGFLAFTVPLLLVLALLAHGPRRLAWVGAAALCSAAVLLTQSRGGALALAGGVALTGALLVVQRRQQHERRARPPRPLSTLVAAGVVATCGVILLATFTAGGIRDELAGTSTAEIVDPDSKFGVWRASSTLVQDNLWTGVGRGGFEPAFTRLHHAGVKTYSHVENEYLQALVDFGLPGTVALALLLVATLFVALGRWRRGPLEAGAVCSLIVLALHNAVDFNLQMPGVVLAAVAVAAMVMPMSVTRVPRERRRARAAGRAALLSAGAAVVALAASPLGRSAHADGDDLAALVRAPDAAPGRAMQEGVRLMGRHPSDYLIAGLTAEAYFHARDARAVDIMNRALHLNPRHPGLHVLAARMLLAGGRSEQALIQFSLALAHTLEPDRILADLLRWFPDPAQAARGLPTPVDRVPVLTNRLVTMGRPDVALAYARRAGDDNPGNHEVLQILSRLALERGEVALALQAGEEAHRSRQSVAGALAYGRALRAAGQHQEAADIAAETLETLSLGAPTGQVIRLYELLADAQLALGHHRAARDTLRIAIGRAGADRRGLVGLYRRLARAEDALGNAIKAREARKLAEEQDSP